MLLYSLLWWLYHFMSSENKVKKCFKILSLSLSLLASGCGSVGKAVNSNTRGPRFKSSHQQKLCIAHLLSAVLKKFSLSLSLSCVCLHFSWIVNVILSIFCFIVRTRSESLPRSFSGTMYGTLPKSWRQQNIVTQVGNFLAHTTHGHS